MTLERWMTCETSSLGVSLVFVFGAIFGAIAIAAWVAVERLLSAPKVSEQASAAR